MNVLVSVVQGDIDGNCDEETRRTKKGEQYANVTRRHCRKQHRRQ
jgi:hypothetical protein